MEGLATYRDCHIIYVALYRYGHYAIIRLQIKESPIRKRRAFLRPRESEKNTKNTSVPHIPPSKKNLINSTLNIN